MKVSRSIRGSVTGTRRRLRVCEACGTIQASTEVPDPTLRNFRVDRAAQERARRQREREKQLQLL
jgi:hypothetical protein